VPKVSRKASELLDACAKVNVKKTCGRLPVVSRCRLSVDARSWCDVDTALGVLMVADPFLESPILP
jgi:hypothetical protein